MGSTIHLEFRGEQPVWRLRVVQPGRFKEAEYRIKVRLFRLKRGSLLGVLLNLYDIPDQPYFIHRVMDLTDPEVLRYVRACMSSGRIMGLFESAGTEQGFERPLDLDGEVWGRALSEGEAHNAGVAADGEEALEQFLQVFGPESRKKGVERAWDEVERRLGASR